MTGVGGVRALLLMLVLTMALAGCSPDRDVTSPATPTPPPPPVAGSPGSSFDDLLVINPSRTTRATKTDLKQAESALGVHLPRGYARFVRRVGGGSLGHFVGVLAPDQLLTSTEDWRTLVQEYWFWDTEESGADRESLQERGILLASSFDGDELCFDPADPETLYVLPRNDDVAHRVGPGFLAALEWMLSGRQLNPWVEGWTFEANNHRVEEHPRFPDDTSLADATRALTALGLHAHVVELDRRTTFFFPEISGRLSVAEEEGLWVDFFYDDEADPAEVTKILDAIKGA